MPSITITGVDLDWERVDNTSITVGPGNTVSESAVVSTGKKAVGGGFNINSTDLVVLFSRPSSAGDSWEVCVHNNGASSSSFDIFAVGIVA